MGEYDHLKIKTFDLWDLYLHEAQYPFLGRCYAWARREEADRISDMTKEERDELFGVVVPYWESFLPRFHSNFRSNLAILGNTSPHLHAHLIPRFKEPVFYDGIEFKDPNPTGNYAPYPKMKLSPELLLRIKKEFDAD